MGFFMDGLDAEAYDRTYTDGQLVRRIIGYFKPKLALMSLITILVVLNSLLDSAFPLLVSHSIDSLSSTQVLQTVVWLVSFILLAGVLSWICNLFRQRFSARTVGDVVLQLREDAFSAVMARDMSFFDEFLFGEDREPCHV